MSTTEAPSTQATNTQTASVGNAADFAVGEMKMKSVGERRVAVIRTPSGIHALDNACPHQGYGLVTGSLDGELVTCQWHNWKFDASTGRCLVGEEDVACHQVDIDDGGEVLVTVTEPTNEERQTQLWPSLGRAIENAYAGQIARDAVRLLDTGATPAEIMWAGFEPAIAKAEYGPGHELALATDCLSIAEARDGQGRALPVVQGLHALADESRDRPRRGVPADATSIDLATAIETEDIDAVMAATVELLEGGADVETMRDAFLRSVSMHHLGYGHGIIYTQKSFELLDLVGWEHAKSVLPHLGVTIAYATREDLLPYMRSTMRIIDDVDLEQLANSSRAENWTPSDELVNTLLDSDSAAIEAAVEAVLHGAGITGLLDALSIAASRRLLRHDLNVEFSSEDHFHWLDVTHALTMTRAVRWAWTHQPGPEAARLALFATWLLHDSGRAERRWGVRPERRADETPSLSIADAVVARDPGAALAAVIELGAQSAGEQLLDAALNDPSGAFIVLAHLVKLTYAAIEETESTGSLLPLLAAARYLSSPRREAFVSRNVHEALDFIRTGKPPQR